MTRSPIDRWMRPGGDRWIMSVPEDMSPEAMKAVRDTWARAMGPTSQLFLLDDRMGLWRETPEGEWERLPVLPVADAMDALTRHLDEEGGS